jgi:hypothetical protein
VVKEYCFFFNLKTLELQGKFEDTKGVTRSRKSKKRQRNGQTNESVAIIFAKSNIKKNI